MAHLNTSLSSILGTAGAVSIEIKCNAMEYRATAPIKGDGYGGGAGHSVQYVGIQISGHWFTNGPTLETLSWLLDSVHTSSFTSPVYLYISEIPSSCALMAIISQLPSVITYLHLTLRNAAVKTILSYLVEPFEVVIDGTATLRWPLPKLTEFYVDRRDDLEPEVVLACIQHRAGRGLFSEGSRQDCGELPARLVMPHLHLPCTSSRAAIMKMFPGCMEWCGLELEHEDEGPYHVDGHDGDA